MERKIIQYVIQSTEEGQLCGTAHERLMLLIGIAKKTNLDMFQTHCSARPKLADRRNPCCLKEYSVKRRYIE